MDNRRLERLIQHFQLGEEKEGSKVGICTSEMCLRAISFGNAGDISVIEESCHQGIGRQYHLSNTK